MSIAHTIGNLGVDQIHCEPNAVNDCLMLLGQCLKCLVVHLLFSVYHWRRIAILLETTTLAIVDRRLDLAGDIAAIGQEFSAVVHHR